MSRLASVYATVGSPRGRDERPSSVELARRCQNVSIRNLNPGTPEMLTIETTKRRYRSTVRKYALVHILAFLCNLSGAWLLLIGFSSVCGPIDGPDGGCITLRRWLLSGYSVDLWDSRRLHYLQFSVLVPLCSFVAMVWAVRCNLIYHLAVASYYFRRDADSRRSNAARNEALFALLCSFILFIAMPRLLMNFDATPETRAEWHIYYNFPIYSAALTFFLHLLLVTAGLSCRRVWRKIKSLFAST